MEYKIVRTDSSDEGIRRIILYLAKNYGRKFALEKLTEMEKQILLLKNQPYIGTVPRYLVLKRQGYRVLILERSLVFYKVDEENKTVIIYAVVDQREDYLSVIQGL